MMAITLSVAIYHALNLKLLAKETKSANIKLETEIGERKKTEENLITQSQIVTNMTEGAYLIRVSDGIILYNNPSFESMFGYEAGEMIGKHVSIVNAPTNISPEEVVKEISQLITRTGSWKGEVLNIKKDGTIFWNSASVTTFTHSLHGEVWVSVHTDISKRKQIEHSLKENQDHLIKAQELSETGNWKLSIKNKEITGSSEFYKIFELPSKELTLDSLMKITHPNDKEAVLKNINNGIAHGTTWEHVYRILLKDGSIKWIKGVGEPIKNKDGQISTIEGVTQNITKMKNQDEIIRRTQKMDAIGQLSAGISHDFNNILGIIIGNIELIELEGNLNKSVNNKLAVVKSSATRASQLIKKLQRISRAEVFDTETFSIDIFIHETLDILAKSLTPQINIKLNFDEGLWLIDSNKGDLQDVLLNLAINARDAMQGSGELTFTLTKESIIANNLMGIGNVEPGEYILLTVSDTGSGISEEDLPHIFDPFFTRKDKDKGTGLGLSMVANFIREYAGFICVDSTLGTGTCFRLYFKKSDNDTSVEVSEPSLLSNVIGNGTVLIVDDEPELVSLAKNVLSSHGYQILTANNANQARTLLKNNPTIDLLFSDIVMPGGETGFDLASFVESEYPHIKILLTSGYNSEESQQGVSSNLLKTILYKPYKPSGMVQRIAALLNEKELTVNSVESMLGDENYQNSFDRLIPDLWQEKLSLGIPSMDDDHKILLTLIHQAKELIENSDTEETKIILDRLMDFTHTHLKREEEVMIACHYPSFEQHQAVHHVLLKQVKKMEKRQQLGNLNMKELFKFLSFWWLDHIQTMDKGYADFCRDNAELIEEAIKRVDAMSEDEKEYK